MYLGIDIGGTKTLIARLSARGEIEESRRFPTSQDYNQFLNDLGAHLKELGLESLQGVCAAVPGRLDRDKGIVRALGNLPWRDKPIRDDIAHLLGDGVKVIIENDARLGGLSEAQLIKSDYKRVLFFTVSTGLGGALIEDGRIVPALQDMEAGKMPLLYRDRIIHWEDFAGGRSVVERFGKQAADITDPEEWQQIGETLAYGLAAVCSVLQPEVIVLGGSVGTYTDKYSGAIQDYLKQHLHPIVRQPKAILAGQRPKEAVIYGCYELLRQGHGHDNS